MATSQISSRQTKLSLFPKVNFVPFFLVTVLFFLWAIPNNLNDVLIKQFMKSFEINRFQAGVVQSAFYLGYFVLAIPAGLLMRKHGYKAGIITGLLLLGTGAFLFWPAALIGHYSFFLIALFIIASGLSFLETSANPFIAQCGDPETSERRLNFSQAFNPIGSVTAAIIGTKFIFSGIELSPEQAASMQAAGTYASYLKHETLRVVMPYMVLAFVAFACMLLIALTKFPLVTGEAGVRHESHGRVKDLLRYPHFLLALVAQFLYVGAQVGTWSYFITYVQDYTSQPEKIAGYFLTGTLAAFGVGRFASAYLMKFVAPNRLMGTYSLINIALVLVGVVFPGWLGLWAILLTSLFMSLMFPTIFALGLKGLGANTKIAGSLLVMTIVGGAVLTPLMGLISQRAHSLALAYMVPFAAYVFIAYYGFVGSSLRGDPLLSTAQ